MSFSKKFSEYSLGKGKYGHHELFRFPNNYGASIIDYGYGREKGLKELAIVKFIEVNRTGIFSALHRNRIVTYWDFVEVDDIIKNDIVLGWLSDQDIDAILEKIFNFKPNQYKGVNENI